MMTKQEAQLFMNDLGRKNIPFLFIIDFDMEKTEVIPLDQVDPNKILYNIDGSTNDVNRGAKPRKFSFTFEPVTRERYAEAFNIVQEHIKHGDSFLLNLTMPSKVITDLSLKEIFKMSKARYRLWHEGQFVVFSPETFVKTENGVISSYPMKGTIDARLPDAANKLRNSRKELAEHYTIVDLIRNDIGMVATNVRVDRFQQIEKIKTHKHELLQMSSVISGEMPQDFHEHLGDLFFKMLPAGSISGAPKLKTVEVIHKAEKYSRGYYTGIFGIFNGKEIDSGVMIRYLEQSDDGLFYKSGGGVTALSNMQEEYQELIDKIYLPFG